MNEEAQIARCEAEKMAGLVEELDTLKEQFKVIDGKRVTESCGSHGANVAVFYVGDECPLCAAIAAPVDDGWRPIDTLPMDAQEEVLLYDSRWSSSPFIGGRWDKDEWIIDGYTQPIKPTYWQPLPPAPKEKP